MIRQLVCVAEGVDVLASNLNLIHLPTLRRTRAPYLKITASGETRSKRAHRSLCLSRLNGKGRRNQDHTQHQRKESTEHKLRCHEQTRVAR
jgi:hypothetical protein